MTDYVFQPLIGGIFLNSGTKVTDSRDRAVIQKGLIVSDNGKGFSLFDILSKQGTFSGKIDVNNKPIVLTKQNYRAALIDIS